jgi:DNA-binding CsgD family transcriptional regulator
LRTDRTIPGIQRLTERELEILKLTSDDLTTGEIAEWFGISVLTIRTHRFNIIRKLGVKSFLAAVAQALRAGVIS